MPKVGKQQFPYTKEGQKAAEKASKQSGKPLKKKK